jgi:hypothetical protein
MRQVGFSRRQGAAVILLGLAFLVSMPAQSAERKEYGYAVLTGEITDPETSQPMAGAKVRLIEVLPADSDVPPETYRMVTDENGRFTFPRLPLKRWSLEVITTDGEVIRGLNIFDMQDDKAQLTLGITRRVDAPTEIATEHGAPGTRWIVVGYEPIKWKRLWLEALIFIGSAAALGVGL